MTFVSKGKGFTLIELVAVILILSVLSAIVLVRFIDVTNQAHESTVKAVGGSFRTAVLMVNAQWMLNGSPANGDDILGFGDGTVDVNSSGWPTDINGANSIPTGLAGRRQCERLFQTLLLFGPTVSAIDKIGFSLFTSAYAISSAPRDPTASYWASAPQINVCQFAYQPAPNMSIRYETTSGAVIVDSDSNS